MSDNPVTAAMEAYLRTHPHREGEVDAAFEKFDPDSEPDGSPSVDGPPTDTGSEQLPLAVSAHPPLTVNEMWLADLVAAERQRQAQAEGRKNTYGERGQGEAQHRDGCYAEVFVARVTGLYWHALLDHHGRQTMPDVGVDIEVRACADQHRKGRRGNLLLHHKDRDDRRYVLVDGEAPNLTIVGYILGIDGKRPHLWDRSLPEPAFKVQRSRLLPL